MITTWWHRLPRQSCDEVEALLMRMSCCPQSRSRSRESPRSPSLSPTWSPPTPSSSPFLSTSRTLWLQASLSWFFVIKHFYIVPRIFWQDYKETLSNSMGLTWYILYHRFTVMIWWFVCVVMLSVWESAHYWLRVHSLRAPERLSLSPAAPGPGTGHWTHGIPLWSPPSPNVPLITIKRRYSNIKKYHHHYYISSFPYTVIDASRQRPDESVAGAVSSLPRPRY